MRGQPLTLPRLWRCYRQAGLRVDRVSKVVARGIGLLRFEFVHESPLRVESPEAMTGCPQFTILAGPRVCEVLPQLVKALPRRPRHGDSERLPSRFRAEAARHESRSRSHKPGQ